jgi:hypothetical protein
MKSIGSSAEEVGVGHPGDLDRVLERQEHAGLGPRFRLQLQQVLPHVGDLALGHLIGRVARQHLGQRALARSIRPHDRVHFARVHRQVDTVEDLLVPSLGVQVLDFQHFTLLVAIGRQPVRSTLRRVAAHHAVSQWLTANG